MIKPPWKNHTYKAWHRGYKTFFMLNSAEHELLNAHYYEKNQEIQHFSGSNKPRILFFMLINVKRHFNIYEYGQEKFHAQLS